MNKSFFAIQWNFILENSITENTYKIQLNRVECNFSLINPALLQFCPVSLMNIFFDWKRKTPVVLCVAVSFTLDVLSKNAVCIQFNIFMMKKVMRFFCYAKKCIPWKGMNAVKIFCPHVFFYLYECITTDRINFQQLLPSIFQKKMHTKWEIPRVWWC